MNYLILFLCLLSFACVVVAYFFGYTDGKSKGYKAGYTAGNYVGRQVMINQYESRRPWLTQENYFGLW